MILFLNFAPIEFMGGAERWMYETAKYISKNEKTVVLSVSESITNLYSRIVLQREFEKRHKISEGYFKTIKPSHFIPFTKNFLNLRSVFKNARKIYIKYEITELFITLYFGGFDALKKTIAGLHSPFYYRSPVRFFDRLHNSIYLSKLSKLIIKNIYKTHVLTKRDQDFLMNRFRLSNIVYVPTSIKLRAQKKRNIFKRDDGLSILFIGELSERKGVDILLELIKNSPNSIYFDIAGNGPLQDKITQVCKKYENCRYHGFLNQSELTRLYLKADVLFLPSRAEGFPLVFHEAMANGLMIVNSPEVKIGLPRFIEFSPRNNLSKQYLELLKKMQSSEETKKKIISFYKNNFSTEVITKRVINLFQ